MKPLWELQDGELLQLLENSPVPDTLDNIGTEYARRGLVKGELCVVMAKPSSGRSRLFEDLLRGTQ